MKVKRIDDFNHDVEVHKNVLSSMPINNQKNLKLYKDKVAEIKEKYVEMSKELLGEIKSRSDRYLSLKENPRVKYLEEDLERLSSLRLLNPLNTPFEKLGMDNVLYRLNHFFKNDLEEVNKDIKDMLVLFHDVGADITDKDFIYSVYARNYIRELQIDDSLERMKYVFEDIHWKCPDVILHVSMNFRLLYNKYKDKFKAYIDSKQNNELSYEDYLIKRENIIKELYELNHYEQYSLLNGFISSNLILGDYTVVNVGKCYSKYLSENTSLTEQKNMIGDFKNLLLNVKEYKNYLKYEFVVNDVKKKYEERTTHLGESLKIAKEIDTMAADLIRINNELNTGKTKGFWIFKKSVDTEKLYVELNAKIQELNNKYDEYDSAMVYDELNKSLTDTSTVYDVFRFALSFKTYLRNCIKSNKDDVTIDIKQIVKEFETFMNTTNISVIKNAKFMLGSDIAEIISDHYQLLHIRLEKAQLDEGNLDALLKDLRIMVNSFYMNSFDLGIDLVNDLFEAHKIISRQDELEKKAIEASTEEASKEEQPNKEEVPEETTEVEEETEVVEEEPVDEPTEEEVEETEESSEEESEETSEEVTEEAPEEESEETPEEETEEEKK